MRRLLVLCVLSFMLSACGSLFPPPGDPTKKYTVESLPHQGDAYNGEIYNEGKSKAASSNPQRPRQLIVDLPTLYSPLDNTRIAVKPQQQTIDYYADVEWADRLSVLIQESLIYSLKNTGGIRGVSRSTEGIYADYALKVEARKFYIDQSNKAHVPTAQAEYMVYLVKLPERHIAASRNFAHTQAIPENTMDAIVKSLNTAHLEASRALTSWVVQSMD